MKTKTLCKEVLLLACMAVAALAKEATPPPATLTLDEVGVTGEKDRERQRDPSQSITDPYTVTVWRDGITKFSLAVPIWESAGVRWVQKEVRFRRESGARHLATEQMPAHQLSADRLSAFNGALTRVSLTLDANVDEADGLPASISFGPHASLVNLDYVRLLDSRRQMGITVANGIDPQTRRCDTPFTLLDEGGDGPNRFILVSDSLADCRRAEKSREGSGSDLVFADSVPEKLRQAVLDAYDPIAARFANRLGSEPALVFVAWLPESAHDDNRFVYSWNRNTLLLFSGAEWQQGLNAQQQDALRTEFTTEQIRRRFRQTNWPGEFIKSAASYVQTLFTAEQARNTSSTLTDALPGWVAGCADNLKDQAGAAAAGEKVTSLECGLLVQFVYDAAARAKSAGRSSLYDTWRRLLSASLHSGKSGANPADFLASSAEAHRIVRGLLDGSVDWSRFAAELGGLGVGLSVSPDADEPTVEVLSLKNFHD